MKVIKNTFKYFVKYLPVAIIGLLLGMLALTCSLMLPKIMGMIVDYGLSDGSGAIVGSFNPFYFLVEGKEYNTIELMALMCGAFVIVLLLKHISIYTRNNLNQYNGMRFNRVLRTLGVKKYWTYGRSAPMGIMFTMLNNNTVNIKEMYANWFPQLFDNFFLVVVGCALVGNINIQLLIVSIAAVPIIVGVSIIYMKRLTKATTRARSCFVDLNYCVEENISNFPLVKQYGREDYETAVFSGYNRRNKDSNIKVNKVMTWYGYVFNIIRAVTYALMIVIGTILAINKKISVGNFLEFVTYIFIILDGITNFMTVCYNINSLSASGNLFVDFMKTKSLNTRTGTEQVVAKPDIQITNLTLVRDNYKLLNDISIDIPYGKKVGITGTSGSGKTLLLKVLNAFEPVDDSMVTIGGKDINKYSEYSLHNTFAQLFEDGLLIDGTVLENITFGSDNVEQGLLNQCIEASGLSQQLDELDNGLQTMVGNGVEISDQLLQSINICRALVYNKDVMLLDEPLKYIGSDIFDTVIKSMGNMIKDKTVIVTSVSSKILKMCDEIICMEEGVIVERGAHTQLMKKRGLYYKIIRQSRKEAAEYEKQSNA